MVQIYMNFLIRDMVSVAMVVDGSSWNIYVTALKGLTQSSLMTHLNSSLPSAAYMHQWTGSALVQIMACRLVRQALIWTNAGTLLIWPLGTNFSEMLMEIQTFSFKKMHLKVLSAKWRQFCPGLNVLTACGRGGCNLRFDVFETH